MNIQTALSNARTFSEILPLAERAEVKFSFWGNRYVCVTGYEGTLHIDALAFKTLNLLKQLNYEFSEVERGAGDRLSGKIDSLYSACDAQFREASCLKQAYLIFIRVVIAVLDRISGAPSIGSEWIGPYEIQNDHFEYYTQAQLLTVFGISPEEAERRGSHCHQKNGINLWQAPG